MRTNDANDAVMLHGITNTCRLFKRAVEEECLSLETITRINEHTLALRSACSGDLRIVDLFIQSNVIPSVAQLCNNLNKSRSLQGSDIDSDVEHKEKLRSAVRTLTVILCRLLANFTACGEISRAYLFSLDQENSKNCLEWLSHVLSAAVQCGSRKATAAAMTVVYNCLLLNESEYHIAVQQRRDIFCTNRPILCQILLSVIENSNSNSNASDASSSQAATRVDGADADPALEWFHMLTFLWMKSGCMIYRIYSVVGPSATAPTVADTVASGAAARVLGSKVESADSTQVGLLLSIPITHEQVS